MKTKLALFFLLALLVPCTLHAELVRNDCDQIPASQRVTNGTLCLQRTAASGRVAGALYVWSGAVWVQQASSGTLTEVQGTASEITATNGTGPIPILSFPATVALPTKILQVGRFELVTSISPAQLVADQDDWNPTDLATADVIRVSTDQSRTIKGLQDGSAGRLITIHNVGSNALVLADSAGTSAAANQFALSGALTLNGDESVLLQYDGISTKWRALATSAGGVVDQTAAYSWTGTHSFQRNKFSILDTADATKILQFDNSGNLTKTTRTWSGPDATTRLIGDSDFSATGLMSRTAANFYAGRTLTAADTGLTITNGNGVAGNPTFALGALAVKTNAPNTWSTGDQNMSAVTSFSVPGSAGYAPTTARYLGYNNTTNKFVGGNGTTTKVFAFADETQPLSSNLTSFTALTGINNGVPVFTGAGAGNLIVAGLPSCPDTSGNHLNYDTGTRAWSCGTSSTGGLAGGTTNKFLLATGASTYDATTGNLTQAAGVVNAAGGFTVGDVATNKLAINPAAVTGTKTWTVMNFNGTIRPSTGAFTPGNVVSTDANGLLIDGGAAGVGDVTLTGIQELQNKTITNTGAGGNNTVTLPIRAFWDGASMTVDGTNCHEPAKTTIGAGPTLYAFSCDDSNSSTFEGVTVLPHALSTVNFSLTVNDVDSSSEVFSGGFKAMCRQTNTLVDGTLPICRM